MATIASLVDDVRPMITAGVPETAIQNAIRWAARDFLRYSRWLRETITVNVLQNTDTYALATSAPSDTEVFGLQAAQYDGDYLTPATQEEVAPNSQGWYFFVAPSSIQLSWLPAADLSSGLLVRALLNLTIDTVSIPDSVLAQWNNHISYGALSRLMSMKTAAWYDAAEAQRYQAMFDEGREMARVEAQMQSKAYAYGSARA